MDLLELFDELDETVQIGVFGPGGRPALDWSFFFAGQIRLESVQKRSFLGFADQDSLAPAAVGFRQDLIERRS